MPSFMLGKVLNAIVGARFPGGVEGWAQAGCDMVALPNPAGKDVAYVLLPWRTTSSLDLKPFRDEVESAAKRYAFEVRWADTPNFDGMNPAEIKAGMEEKMTGLRSAAKASVADSEEAVRLVTVMHRPALFMVVMTGGDEREAEAILDLLAGSEGLERAAVFTPAAFVERVYRRNTGLQAEHQGLGRPIAKDDVTDLQILLHKVESVDEFLKGLK